MEASDAVPWLALGLAAVSFGWQVIDARRRRATRVAIEIQHAAVPASAGGSDLLDMPALGLDTRTIIWPTDEPLTYVVVVTAVNRGESEEWLQDMRVYDVAKTIGGGANPGGPPLVLPPRGRRPWPFRVDHAAFDVNGGFYIDLILGAKTIRSGPYFLDSRLVAEIAEHNAAVEQEQGGNDIAQPG